ncbi:MAG: 50S ribosomal protein L24 [Candidatus Aenigmatarchaeota archaeon]|nr:MAG: 50S ribosomal protein L24 [Candidatus Aenigmarchaeota archaeon]
MRKEWSSKWIRSKQPRKQRKYRYNAPLHIRRKFVSAHLSPELRERFGKRSFPLRKGDEVKVMRGEFRGFKGVVEKVNLRDLKIYIEDLKVKKADGSEVLKPLRSSNLMIVKLNLDDKKRLEALERGTKTASVKE